MNVQAVAAAAQPKAREPYSGEKLRVVDADDWAVQHLREHMGERVAFYFAFLNHYSAALAPVRSEAATPHRAPQTTAPARPLTAAALRALCVCGCRLPSLCFCST